MIFVYALDFGEFLRLGLELRWINEMLRLVIKNSIN